MINKVILVGNVGADPEVRALEGGSKVARIRLATTERIYNRQTQESRDHTEWHTVTVWRSLADVADKYIRKGSKLYIEGNLRTREWTDKDGNKRYSTEILGNELKMLDRRSDSASEGGYGGGASAAPAPAPAPAAAPQSAPAPQPTPVAAAVEDPDDLPF